ncbi:MAG: PilZ domain-containing protein, partial [Thermodesulfobacteriota bacterium]
MEHYHLQYLVISDDQSVILVPARMFVTNGNGLTVQLPEQSFVISQRQAPRFPCQGFKAELWQNGFQAEGVLMDFGPHAFRIRVQSDPPSSFHWFNIDTPATIRLSDGKDVLYSGNCNCMYQKQDGRSREVILTHTHDQIQRFKANVLRNPRRQSSPPLHAIFEHPFIKKQVQREIFDISTTGFSICDKSDEVVLIPGMIIPDMTITYAGILKIRCKAQVIYRKEGDDQVRFGLVILDMDLTNYNHLNQVLNNMHGADTGMLNEVNLDALWEFFFDTDFIYPKKYKMIQS